MNPVQKNVCPVFDNNDADFIAAARTGWPEAIERAIEAEKILALQSDDLISTQMERNEAMKQLAALREATDKLAAQVTELQNKGAVNCMACKCKNATENSGGGCPECFDCNGAVWLSEHGYTEFINDKTLPMCPMFKPDYSKEKELSAQVAGLREAFDLIRIHFAENICHSLTCPYEYCQGEVCKSYEIRKVIASTLNSPYPGAAIRERMARLEAVAEAAKKLIDNYWNNRINGQLASELAVAIETLKGDSHE